MGNEAISRPTPTLHDECIYIPRKEPLSPAVENAKLNSNKGVPEAAFSSEELQVRKLIAAEKVWELDGEGLLEDEIIKELTFLAHEKGFLLSNLVLPP